MAGVPPSTHAYPRQREGGRQVGEILGGLGSCRCQSFCRKDLKGWTAAQFQIETPSISPTYGEFMLPRPEQEYFTTGSCGQSLVEGSDCTSGQSRFSRLLQPSFPGPQKDRRLETCNRSVPAKPVFAYPIFQDGDCRIHQRLSPTGPMGQFSRSYRRLSSHTNGKVYPQISKIYSTGEDVPICSSPIWAGNSTKGVHNGSQRVEEDCLKNGTRSIPIHRRLVKPCMVFPPVCPENFTTPKADTNVRLVSEY